MRERLEALIKAYEQEAKELDAGWAACYCEAQVLRNEGRQRAIEDVIDVLKALLAE